MSQPNRDRQGAAHLYARGRDPLANARGSDASGTDTRGTDAPAAYLITFRTYASWLPGDARGTVDRLHNQPGTPLLPPDHNHEDSAKRRAGETMTLSPAQRDLVGRGVREMCNHRSWELYAVNVRSNHVHVVVSGSESPERIMTAFKAWSTRRMRQAGLMPSEKQAWSRHGSTRYLWDLKQIEAACQYVQEAQDEPR